jgi:hypothetical protein
VTGGSTSSHDESSNRRVEGTKPLNISARAASVTAVNAAFDRSFIESNLLRRFDFLLGERKCASNNHCFVATSLRLLD